VLAGDLTGEGPASACGKFNGSNKGLSAASGARGAAGAARWTDWAAIKLAASILMGIEHGK